MAIPRVIHYCWFGRKKKPELVEKCIASWRKYCPEWKIIEWNEDNFDIDFCPYAKKAYNLKKYAFLTDAARLKIIYEHGGIYLDTDVELLRPLDKLLGYDAWFGYMKSVSSDKGVTTEINTGSGFGAIAGNWFIKRLLNQYLSFDDNQPFRICNEIDTAMFVKEWNGFRFNEAVLQEFDHMIIIDDIWRYTFHHCTNTWLPWYKRFKNLLCAKWKERLNKM